MIGVITGDIINSRMNSPEKWLLFLKVSLQKFGEEYKVWEIFRGDSFQLKIENTDEIFRALVYIKVCIRQLKGVDVRMGIGIGAITYDSKQITKSNGEAFIFSGEAFEALRKKTLLLKTRDTDFDEEMNLYLELALLKMDSWTVKESILIKNVLENPEFNQNQLAKLLGKTQSTISETLKRTGFEEIMKIEKIFRKKIEKK